MNVFLENHKRILELLNNHNVDYIIIGGYSVIFHGYARTTGDLDIWLKPDNENKNKLKEVLVKLGITEESVRELDAVNFSKVVAFSIDVEPQKVDFLTKVNLVDFEEAAEKKIIEYIDEIPIPFLHINHLILSKMNTGRLKDAADIEELQRILKQKNRI